MKIKTLTLNNFRGFPGPVPQAFSLEGKNLLVYGENGSGKSSIYHALKTFFTLQHPQYMEVACNVFSGQSEHWIEVEFDDGQSAVKWIGPPDPKPWTPDIRVTQAANRRGCLDYRSILDTNYGHGGGRINLFEIAVNTLLADYSVPVPGGSVSTIAELWANVIKAKPKTHNKRALEDVFLACLAFNQGFNRALTQIKLQVDSLLMELPVEGMVLDKLVFEEVRYNSTSRWFDGMVLEPRISLRGYPVDYPQHFINEARLSALGLAIYLAGRLTCVPTGGSYLKLLVLDDVLIGIDLSNRLPLLDLLVKIFDGWQIVLLTYDKTWFDMAWIRLEESAAWTYISIFEGAVDGSFGTPIVVPKNTSARSIALAKARDFLHAKEYQAAANYARSAFEAALKQFCEKRSVAVPFNANLREMSSEDFLEAIRLWSIEDSKRIFYAAVLERTRLFRRIILNPLSHADAPAVRSEVEGAIAAVEALEAVLNARLPQHPKLLEEIRDILKAPAPTANDHQKAIANLRTRFGWSLSAFCERHSVNVPFKTIRYEIIDLWEIVLTDTGTFFTGHNAGLGTYIDAERKWLMEDLDQADLDALTSADIQRILAVLCPTKTEKLVLDIS